MLVAATSLGFAVDEVVNSKIFLPPLGSAMRPAQLSCESKSGIELFPLTLCLSEYQLITFTSSVTATYKFVYNIVKLPFYKYIL